MVDHLTALHGLVERAIFQQICLEDFKLARIFGLQCQKWLAFRAVIESAHSSMNRRAALEKKLHHIDCDEACAAGDKSDRHGSDQSDVSIVERCWCEGEIA